MRIDGKSIRLEQAKQLNHLLDKFYGDNVDAVFTESRRAFSDLTFGPDAKELFVGGDTIYMHDINNSETVCLQECLCNDDSQVVGRRTTDIANHRLFVACCALSPLETLPGHLKGERL